MRRSWTERRGMAGGGVAKQLTLEKHWLATSKLLPSCTVHPCKPTCLNIPLYTPIYRCTYTPTYNLCTQPCTFPWTSPCLHLCTPPPQSSGHPCTSPSAHPCMQTYTPLILPPVNTPVPPVQACIHPHVHPFEDPGTFPSAPP